jgi:hypothetical protein
LADKIVDRIVRGEALSLAGTFDGGSILGKLIAAHIGQPLVTRIEGDEAGAENVSDDNECPGIASAKDREGMLDVWRSRGR